MRAWIDVEVVRACILFLECETFWQHSVSFFISDHGRFQIVITLALSLFHTTEHLHFETTCTYAGDQSRTPNVLNTRTLKDEPVKYVRRELDF